MINQIFTIWYGWEYATLNILYNYLDILNIARFIIKVFYNLCESHVENFLRLLWSILDEKTCRSTGMYEGFQLELRRSQDKLPRGLHEIISLKKVHKGIF